MAERVQKIDVRGGYDRWSTIYDQRPSALVALDRRHTMRRLDPQKGERVLDAGCGTGAHLESIHRAGAGAMGLDVSVGMLAVARARESELSLVQADLDQPLPLRPGHFDAVLCSLVSEHLANLESFFAATFDVLRGGGRLVFAAFHPEMAAAGVEANFELEGTEYRLGAELYTTRAYLEAIGTAGFEDCAVREFEVDADLVREAPSAAKHLGRPLLLLIEARRPGGVERV